LRGREAWGSEEASDQKKRTELRDCHSVLLSEVSRW